MGLFRRKKKSEEFDVDEREAELNERAEAAKKQAEALRRIREKEKIIRERDELLARYKSEHEKPSRLKKIVKGARVVAKKGFKGAVAFAEGVERFQAQRERRYARPVTPRRSSPRARYARQRPEPFSTTNSLMDFGPARQSRQRRRKNNDLLGGNTFL